MLSSLKRLRINQTKINIKEINKLHAHHKSEEIWLISVTCDKFYVFFFYFYFEYIFSGLPKSVLMGRYWILALIVLQAKVGCSACNN